MRAAARRAGRASAVGAVPAAGPVACGTRSAPRPTAWRGGPYGTTGPAGATVSGALGRTRPAGPGDPRGPARSAKDLLLGAGGLLLAFAALVFVAWSYGRLGPAARCGALVAAAGASVAASWVAARRGHGQGARRRSWLRRSVRRRLRRRPAPRARPSLRRTRTRSAGGPNTAGTRRQTPPRPSGLGSPRSSRPRCSSRYLIRPAAPDGCSCCYRSARPF